MKIFAQIVLGLAIFIMGYLLYNTKDSDKVLDEIGLREELLNNRINDVKDIETLYNQKHGVYTSSFNDLIDFYNFGKFSRAELRDSVTQWGWRFTVTDSIYTSVIDSIYRLSETFDIANLGKIPNTNNMLELNVIGDTTTQNLYIKAPNNKIFEGIDNSVIISKNELLRKNKEYPGVKVKI